MSIPSYPASKPEIWPARTQDRETFNAASAAVFDHYDDLPAFYEEFATEANSLAAALVSGNLPSLTGNSHKSLYVNSTATSVELDNPAKFAAASATTLGRIGDSDAVTFADGVSDTIDLDDGLAVAKSHTILMIGFSKFRLNAATANRNFRVQLAINGSVQALSQTTGSVEQTLNASQHVTNFSVFATATTGTAVPISLQAACDDDVHLDRAHIMALAIRSG